MSLLAMRTVLFWSLIALPDVAHAQALAPAPASPDAWAVLQDFQTRPLDEIHPGWAFTREVLSGIPVLVCVAGDGCYLVIEMRRCSAEDAARCGHPSGTLLRLGERAAPLPPSMPREDPPPPPPPPPPPLQRRSPSSLPQSTPPPTSPRAAPLPEWIGEARENRWGWELSVGGTLGVGLGAGTNPDGTRTPGAWLVAGGMVSIGVRQAHAFRRGIGLDGLVSRLSIAAYLPPLILGAVPPSVWVGNYVGFDLRVRVLPHVRLLSSSEPLGWPSGRITVGVAPALYVISRERRRFPSVLQMLVPEFGVAMPFGPAAGLYLGSHLPGIPFAALLTPHVGIEFEPKTLFFIPLDGSPYEAQLLATLSVVVR